MGLRVETRRPKTPFLEKLCKGRRSFFGQKPRVFGQKLSNVATFQKPRKKWLKTVTSDKVFYFLRGEVTKSSKKALFVQKANFLVTKPG